MRNELKHITLAGLLTAFTFPEWTPEFHISVDGSCAWLYNHLFAEKRDLLTGLIFPHGPLDFLQTPLPIGHNLEIALIANTLLQFLFAWSGLRLAAALGQQRYWIQVLLLAIALELNRMDLLLFATTAHFILLRIFEKKSIWLLPAVLLTGTGLLIKTIIGMPGAFMLGIAAWMLFGTQRQWLKLLAVPVSVLAVMALWWIGLFGSMKDFGLMLQGTFFLMQGNSGAVCHYPQNNWWLLGVFWAIWLGWPLLSKKNSSSNRARTSWVLLLLPAFAFWKYGMSREDIWHLHVTFRFFVWAFGILLLLLPVMRTRFAVAALLALSCFHLNLRSAEGWSQFDMRPFGLSNLYEWTVRFQEKKQAAIAAGKQNMKAQVFPDSIREIIGDRTTDIYPWHYSYAAANGLNLSPRHIPQSYAAYHPWLDAQDAAFFAGETAPDFIVFHLKPYEEEGQFNGLDSRNLLQDAPQTMLAIADRYQVRARQSRFLLLEKTNNHFLGESQTIAFQPGWQQQLPQEAGITRIKTHFEKSFLGKIKSLLYKDDPVMADVRTGEVTRRIKIVPALAPQGLWLSPWMEQPSLSNEPYRVPDDILFHFPLGNTWKQAAETPELVWTRLDPRSGLLPVFAPAHADSSTVLYHLDSLVTAPPNGFSPGWTQTFSTPPPAGKRWVFEANTSLQSPHNNSCSSLVLAVTDASGKTVHYAATEYCGMGIGQGTFWPIGLRTELPADIAVPYTVKVYVWNTGSSAVAVKGMSLIRYFDRPSPVPK